tara:strand:+ start:706 stop:1587 length:882 start_codon:yes stop_codon:yes gene_type:complete
MRKHPRPNHPTVLKNQNCPFCGRDVGEDGTKEHVIARNFVPKGSLDQHWNLIVRACKSCNNRKSDLEDDISAISMIPDLSGSVAEDDEMLRVSSERKQKSKSRKTGKPVSDSQEQINFKGAFGPDVTMTGNFVSPPQISEDRVFELCRLHLSAFFFFQTYDESTLRGGFWLEGFYPVSTVRRSDWGNATQQSFLRLVDGWDPRFYLSTASGFFRVITRMDPTETCWAWAIEWNRNMRTIGFFGNRQVSMEAAAQLEQPVRKVIGKNSEGPIYMIEEMTLQENEDKMFVLEDAV